MKLGSVIVPVALLRMYEAREVEFTRLKKNPLSNVFSSH